MAPWRQALLAAYYHGSRPYRAWLRGRAADEGRAAVMILFYHRVADDRANTWTCPCDLFARQMAWIKRNCDVISLAEAQQRLRTGNRRPAVSVTFDDGYADNNAFA